MTFYAKAHCVDASRFTTNNDAGNAHMNELCLWANQGRTPFATTHCWHNGTVIIISIFNGHGAPKLANVGDWIVKDSTTGDLAVVTDEDFQRAYAFLPQTKGAVDAA